MKKLTELGFCYNCISQRNKLLHTHTHLIVYTVTKYGLKYMLRCIECTSVFIILFYDFFIIKVKSLTLNE